MLNERKLSPLILTGLEFTEKKLKDNELRGKSFIYLPAIRLQTECYCHLTRLFNVVGVSSQAENMFLKKHLNLSDPINIIIKKLVYFRETHPYYDTRCEFCWFTSKIKPEERQLFYTLSISNNYRIAAGQLGISEKFFRRKVYSFTSRMNISNRRLFHWWISCLRRDALTSLKLIKCHHHTTDSLS